MKTHGGSEYIEASIIVFLRSSQAEGRLSMYHVVGPTLHGHRRWCVTLYKCTSRRPRRITQVPSLVVLCESSFLPPRVATLWSISTEYSSTRRITEVTINCKGKGKGKRGFV